MDDEALRAAAHIHRLAICLEKRSGKALAPLGITLWQLDVLAALRHAPRQGLHANQLIPPDFLSPAAMTNRLHSLEKAGWIHRIPDPADRRAVRIRLTPAGRAITRRGLQTRASVAAAAFSTLTPEQRTQLAAHVSQVLGELCESECPGAASTSSTSNH